MQADISGIDLSGTDLTAATFYGANLSGADLSGCTLTFVQLKSADVSNASLIGASLSATDLIGADFSGSNLSRTDLTGAALQRGNLIDADLSRANFNGTILSEANLSNARVPWANLFHAILCDLDVSAFCNEPSIRHGGPSHIDFRTVLKSYHHPRFRQFISDCGVPHLFSEFMIDCARASDDGMLMELMRSTFISYGGPDEAFAQMLYEALKARGVVTFFFPQTATVGARIGDEVFRGIQTHDRVLLVCSRESLERVGVIIEIQETLDREARDGGATYLLPITLDDYVFKDWARAQPALAERVTRRVVADFRGARRSKVKFEAALSRVIDVLKKKRPVTI